MCQIVFQARFNVEPIIQLWTEEYLHIYIHTYKSLSYWAQHVSAARAICFAVLFTCFSMLIADVVVVFMETKLVSRKGVAAKKDAQGLRSPYVEEPRLDPFGKLIARRPCLRFVFIYIIAISVVVVAFFLRAHYSCCLLTANYVKPGITHDY